MTDVVVDTAELYRRYKSLTIAVSAALILGKRLDDIAVAVDDLGREAAGTPCSEPALTLRRLVERGLAGESTDAEVEQVRSSHRGLRREVWTTHPCEYVPCCAVGAHEHR